MSKVLQLAVEDDNVKEIDFKVQRVLVAANTGRDQAQVLKHIEELVKEGALSAEAAQKKKESVFYFWPILPDLITTDDRITVLDDNASSGEVEFVLLIDERGVIYVGMGSDHTDRRLQKQSVAAAKNICPKVIAKKVWRYESVIDHWDNLILRAWVEKEGQRHLYQDGRLTALMRPEELINGVRAHVEGELGGMVIYGGTVPAIGGIYCSPRFEAELVDENLGRSIRFTYSVQPLNWYKE